MLTVIDRNGGEIERLSLGDMEAMLAAFARPGATQQAREDGAAVVRKVGQYRRWFACDCLGPGEAPPVLIPVTGSHIRRESHRPDHADGCPFEMDAEERERYAASLRERMPQEGFCLAANFPPPRATPDRGRPDQDDEDKERDPSPDGAAAGQETRRGVSKASRRDKVSQLLFELLDRAHLNRIGPVPRDPQARLDALNGAAQEVLLGENLCLHDVLETDAALLQDLVRHIGARRHWPRGRRPHGVMIFVVSRIEDDVLVAVSGTRVTVEGAIAVFGPGRGRVRQGPFVAAVLVASPDGRAPPVPLQAYAHPCWADDDMMPVDSTHERRCLNILVRFQNWMTGQHLHVYIEKPLYDLSKYYTGLEEPEVVVKPDFRGVIQTSSGAFIRSFVVEVMGFDHDEYVKQKKRLKGIVKGKDAWWIEHPAHRGIPEAEGDTSLRQDLLRLGQWAAAEANTLRPPPAPPLPNPTPPDPPLLDPTPPDPLPLDPTPPDPLPPDPPSPDPTPLAPPLPNPTPPAPPLPNPTPPDPPPLDPTPPVWAKSVVPPRNSRSAEVRAERPSLLQRLRDWLDGRG